MTSNTPHLCRYEEWEDAISPYHIIQTRMSAVHRPFFLENYHIFYKGLCENTFISM